MSISAETNTTKISRLIQKLSRLQDITSKFGLRSIFEDWDSSSLENSLDVDTETHQDREILKMSRPRLIDTTDKFCGCQDRAKGFQDWYCIKNIPELWQGVPYYLSLNSIKYFFWWAPLLAFKTIPILFGLVMGHRFGPKPIIEIRLSYPPPTHHRNFLMS